jgi:hypothetical protein
LNTSVKSSLKCRKDEEDFEMIFIKKEADRYDIGQVFFRDKAFKRASQQRGCVLSSSFHTEKRFELLQQPFLFFNMNCLRNKRNLCDISGLT